MIRAAVIPPNAFHGAYIRQFQQAQKVRYVFPQSSCSASDIQGEPGGSGDQVFRGNKPEGDASERITLNGIDSLQNGFIQGIERVHVPKKKVARQTIWLTVEGPAVP
jgi:hypothetical protein